MSLMTRRFVTIFCCLSVLGCGSSLSTIRTIQSGDLCLVYSPQIDRVLYLGCGNGPNVLNLAPDLFRNLSAKTYCFRGGSYTWLAPQKEWIAADGCRSEWPPEPAMDRGPMQVREVSDRQLLLEGPVLPRFVREEKRWTLTDDRTLQFSVTLIPADSHTVNASVWSTSTAPLGAIVAVLKGPMRFDNPTTAAAWTANVKTIGAWQVLNTGTSTFHGKAFLSAAPVVATWRAGQWLIRTGSETSLPRHPADSIVELYVAQDKGIVELEMIGPYLPILPDGSNHWDETWRILPASEPDLNLLNLFIPVNTPAN